MWKENNHKKMLLIVCFVLLLCSSFSVAAENTSIRGLVVSADSNTPISYALVRVVDSIDASTHANEDGEFTLKLPRPGTYTIKASIEGDLTGESQPIVIDTKELKDKISLHVVLVAQLPVLVVTARAPLIQASALGMGTQ